MTDGIAEAPAAGVGKLLMDNRFLVPNHQRDYSWTQDEIRKLFEDLDLALQKDATVYFLGLMVFLNSPKGPLVVLDGQQRLATAVIIFSAIRSWLSQYSEYQDDSNKIQEWFIGRSELGEKKPEPRLSLNSANDKTFNDYVVKSVPLEDIKSTLAALKSQDRNRKLLEATLMAREAIAKLAAAQGDSSTAAKYLFKMVTFLRDRVSVVRLSVSSEEAAFTIFETLNDRGLDLSPLDLVKNHLFSKADAESPLLVRDMEERWAQMMSALGNARPDNFLKAFWTSRHGRIRSNDLFNAFKKEYPTTEAAISLSEGMLKAAEQYAALELADDPLWTPYSADARSIVRALKTLGGQQTHPILLAALNRFTPNEMTRLLRLLEVMTVRYLGVGAGATGRFESVSAIVARKIHAKEIATATEAFQDFKELYPSDEDFKQAFRGKQERSNQKAQYYLREIEREARRAADGKLPGELEPGINLTIDHIMPRGIPAADWQEVHAADQTFYDDCVLRIGNMCLLTEVNKELGNKGFAAKRMVYDASKLLTTRSLGGYPEWNRKNVDDRQQWLAKLAAATWRFP